MKKIIIAVIIVVVAVIVGVAIDRKNTRDHFINLFYENYYLAWDAMEAKTEHTANVIRYGECYKPHKTSKGVILCGGIESHLNTCITIMEECMSKECIPNDIRQEMKVKMIAFKGY